MRFLIAITLALTLLPATYLHAQELPVHEKLGGEFVLTDQRGFEIRMSDFRDQIVLLTFGFTHCPDVCPNTLFSMRSVMDKLGDSTAGVQVLFVTLDPERDYVERLKAFVEYFNPNFIGLTGSVDAVKAVADQYGIEFHKYFMEGSDLHYSIDHNAAIFLLDQQGKVRQIYKISESPKKIAQDVKSLQAQK